MSDNPVNLTIKKNPDLDMELEVDLDDQDIGHDQSMYIAQAASQLGKKRHKNCGPSFLCPDIIFDLFFIQLEFSVRI